ncbi:MAG: hypothetical protein OEM63_02870 [Gammaproteobacteria bacterium]|nr:hypothetical protein [Gammaproteobacteria bacterium]
MTGWYRFWRRVAAFLVFNTPIRSYGELVLRAVTIAERASVDKAAANARHNKT